MKIHKLSLLAALTLGGLLAGAGNALAQNQNTNTNAGPRHERRRPPSVEQRVERMNAELNLTEEQKTKVTALFEEDAKKMQELRGNKELTREEQREKFRAMRAQSESKLKQILTPEQWEKHQQRMRPARPPAPPEGEKKPDAKSQ